MKKYAFSAFLVKKMSFMAPKVIFGAFVAFKALFPILLVIIFAPGGVERAWAVLAVAAVQFAIFVADSFREFSEDGKLGIPVPPKRFTKVTEDDMVSIDSSRLQELLLYTGELEDWLESKGYLLRVQNETDDAKEAGVDETIA